MTIYNFFHQNRILKLYIPMENIQTMHIAYRTKHLNRYLSDIFLVRLMRIHIAQKISSLTDFCHYIQIFMIVIYLIKLDDIWMI